MESVNDLKADDAPEKKKGKEFDYKLMIISLENSPDRHEGIE